VDDSVELEREAARPADPTDRLVHVVEPGSLLEVSDATMRTTPESRINASPSATVRNA